MSASETILLVEDDRDLLEFLEEVLSGAGFDVRAVASAGKALAYLAEDPPVGLVITDLVMPGLGGADLLEEVRRAHRDVNVIVITAFGSIESAIDLVRAGAYDYLTKPFKNDELLLVVERALEEGRLRREVDRLTRGAGRPIPGFLGVTRVVQELAERVHRVARTAMPVLVCGETGTGKELVARALDELSGRSTFVAVNCAALPENLLESELFGHERGAFSGADREKQGLFEAADGGTLFLDEIGELPVSLQPKLLRALEGGEVRRVGATRGRTVDVRIVAATNRDLKEAVTGGSFREDLLYRLDAVQLQVPPLRERVADIPLLAEHFLSGVAGAGNRTLSPDALALLTRHPWPGNVRELRNVVESSAALSDAESIGVNDLPERIRDAAGGPKALADGVRDRLSLRELERRYILETLRETGGNRSRAADLLGLDRKTLYRKLQEYRGEGHSLPD